MKSEMVATAGNKNIIKKGRVEKLATTQCGTVLAFCCFLTVMSQLPQIVELGISSILSQIVWILFLLWALVIKKCTFTIRKVQVPLFTTLCTSIFMITASIITGIQYYTSSVYMSFLLSVFMLFVGILVAPKLNKDDLLICGKWYVYASLIVAVITFFAYFWGVSISGAGYIYASKNSLAVILMTAVVIIVSGLNRKDTTKWISFIEIAFLIVMIAILKCRAVLVSVPVIILIAIFTSGLSKKIKLTIVVLCGVFCALLLNDQVYQIVIEDILFAGQGDSLIESSSGRLDMWLNFFDDMEGKWLIGDGTSFRESLFLEAIINYGLIIGGAFIAYALWPLFKGISMYKHNRNQFSYLLVMIAVVYIIDAVFEQLAPFGPGARCFYLWIVFGVLISNPSLTKKENEGMSDLS